MATLTAMFVSRLEDHPEGLGRQRIPASLAPSAAQRALLEARRLELTRSLTATPGPAVTAAVLMILASGTSYGADERQIATKVRVYASALEDIPTWAVERARRTFTRGGWTCGWNGRGNPSSADVYAECRAYLAPILAELKRIEAVLRAEPVEIPESTLEPVDIEGRKQAALADARRQEAESRRRTADQLAVLRQQREEREAAERTRISTGAPPAPMQYAIF